VDNIHCGPGCCWHGKCADLVALHAVLVAQPASCDKHISTIIVGCAARVAWREAGSVQLLVGNREDYGVAV